MVEDGQRQQPKGAICFSGKSYRKRARIVIKLDIKGKKT